MNRMNSEELTTMITLVHCERKTNEKKCKLPTNDKSCLENFYAPFFTSLSKRVEENHLA